MGDNNGLNNFGKFGATYNFIQAVFYSLQGDDEAATLYLDAALRWANAFSASNVEFDEKLL